MDDARLLHTLTVAFLNDPLYRWLYPDAMTRPAAVEANLRLTLSLVRERGHVATDPDGTAVALWTAPGVPLLTDPAPFLELLDRWAPERVAAALAGMAACGAHAEPSDAVLHVLAVHPSRQGRGMARQLLAATLHELDRQGTSSYLESSNARNLSFYQRAGFRPLAEVVVPEGGPSMYPLRRHAAGGRGQGPNVRSPSGSGTPTTTQPPPPTTRCGSPTSATHGPPERATCTRPDEDQP